jgi:hypothetical protein
MALVAAPASAATYRINLWGATAQYQLYNQSAATFLINNYGCPSGTASAPSNGVTSCVGSSGDTYVIAVASKASYDGLLALEGKAKAEDLAAANANPAKTNYFCNPSTYPTSCNPGASNDSCNYFYRVFGDSTCQRVDVALLDTQPSSFTQDTAPGTPIYTTGSSVVNPRKFSSDPLTVPGTFNSYNPLVDPFAFYAHNDVTYSTCAAGSIEAGHQCNASDGGTAANATDCPVGPLSACTNGACAGGKNSGSACKSSNDCPASYGACVTNPISNISRLQAILIFSRQAINWTDLGLGYNSAAPGIINVCYRVAGSGTHATLDYGVMKGKGYVMSQGLPTTNTDPNMWFTDGTGDEIGCVNSKAGAIGYADADQALSMPTLWAALGKTGNPTYANTIALAYEGIMPSRRALRNGEYDDFYSLEWVFQDPSDPNMTGTPLLMFQTLMAQLALPTAIDATDRKAFWASYGETNGVKVNEEMWFMKTTDQAYPGTANPAPHDAQNP